MKSSLERSHLVHALSRVRSVVETRSTLPVLSHVHIKASDGKLTLTGTDIDIWIDETCDAKVATEGSAVVKAQKLFDIARAMPEGSDIHLEVKNNALTLKAGAARFVLSSMAQEALPRREKLQETKKFQIAAPDLLKMLASTSFAISDDESRYYLNGVYLHSHKKEDDDKSKSTFRAVATDGHRLARIELEVDGTENLPGVILPRKAAQELRKLLEDADQEVDVKLFRQEEEKDGDLDNTRVTVMEFAFGKTTLTSRLIDGSFPDYERVIPKDNDKVMQFSCKEFSERVAAVHYMSSETTHGVKFNLKHEKDKKGSLHISAHHGTDGEGNYPLEVEYEGEPIEVGYNALYLLAMTRDVIPSKAEFRWKDPETAAVVRNCEDDSVLYVLMPMRV